MSIDITAHSSELGEDLRRASLSAALKDDKDAVPSDYMAATRADYRRMLQALYLHGFYSGDVSIRIDGREAADIPLHTVPSRISAVTIRVVPGPRFTFGAARVAPLPPGAAQSPDLGRGKPARAQAIRDAARAGTDAWRDVGHAKASVDSSAVTANHATSKLDADIRLDPGPKLRFGYMLVDGDTKVRAARIRAISGLPSGKLFDPDALERATKRLRDTGTFGAVTLVEADTWTRDLTLPITAQVSDRAPRRIGAGIEYASDDGLRLSAFWLHRNLLGGAERLRISAKAEQLGLTSRKPGYGLDIDFTRPATFGADNKLHLNLSYSDKTHAQYYLRTIQAEAALSRAVNDHFRLRGGIGFLSGQGRDATGTHSYTMWTLPFTASEERRDARKGYYIAAQATPFLGTRGIGRGFHFRGDARGYLTVGARENLTLAGRVQIGSLAGTTASKAPLDYVFYSGGGGTVRGQPYQSLGVETPSGTIGGNSFFGFQAEARARINDKFGVVGFVDGGHVGRGSMPLSNGAWHAGAGIGVRYNTPLGPIRLDIAAPISGPRPGKSGQIYLGIGQAF